LLQAGPESPPTSGVGEGPGPAGPWGRAARPDIPRAVAQELRSWRRPRRDTTTRPGRSRGRGRLLENLGRVRARTGHRWSTPRRRTGTGPRPRIP